MWVGGLRSKFDHHANFHLTPLKGGVGESGWGIGVLGGGVGGE